MKKIQAEIKKHDLLLETWWSPAVEMFYVNVREQRYQNDDGWTGSGAELEDAMRGAIDLYKKDHA